MFGKAPRPHREKGRDKGIDVGEKSTMYLGALEEDMQKDRIAVLRAESAKVLPILKDRLGKDGRYLGQLQLDVISYDVVVDGDYYDCSCDIDARIEAGADAQSMRRQSVDFYDQKQVPIDGDSIDRVMFSAEELADKILSTAKFQNILDTIKKKERAELGAMAPFVSALEGKMEEMLPVLQAGLGEDAGLLGGLDIDVQDLDFEYADDEKGNNSVYYNIDVYLDMAGQKKKFKLASEKSFEQGVGPSFLTPEDLAAELLAAPEFQDAVKEAKKVQRVEERVAKRTERTDERLAKRASKDAEGQMAAFKKNMSRDVREAFAAQISDPSFIKSIEFDDRVTDISYDANSGQWTLQVYPTVTLQKDGQVKFYERGSSNIIIQKPGTPNVLAVTPDDIAQAILGASDLRVGRHIAALETEKFMESDEDVLALKKGLAKGREKLGNWYKLWKKSKETGKREIALSHMGDELKQLASTLKSKSKGLMARKSAKVGENMYLAEAISDLEDDVDGFDDEVAVASA